MLDGAESDQARAIDTLLARYVVDRVRFRKNIISFWSERYAPLQFSKKALALLAEFLQET
jgi:hypothetical protein